ncbi:hypothetical protein J6590_020134, partial [Homalodisca vitripennis]
MAKAPVPIKSSSQTIYQTPTLVSTGGWSENDAAEALSVKCLSYNLRLASDDFLKEFKTPPTEPGFEPRPWYKAECQRRLSLEGLEKLNFSLSLSVIAQIVKISTITLKTTCAALAPDLRTKLNNYPDISTSSVKSSDLSLFTDPHHPVVPTNNQHSLGSESINALSLRPEVSGHGCHVLGSPRHISKDVTKAQFIESRKDTNVARTHAAAPCSRHTHAYPHRKHLHGESVAIHLCNRGFEPSHFRPETTIQGRSKSPRERRAHDCLVKLTCRLPQGGRIVPVIFFSLGRDVSFGDDFLFTVDTLNGLCKFLNLGKHLGNMCQYKG